MGQRDENYVEIGKLCTSVQAEGKIVLKKTPVLNRSFSKEDIHITGSLGMGV